MFEQRQFVHIETSQQHQLTSLLSTIQRDVPPQPSQSYLMPDSDDKSDGDDDDGLYLTSPSKTSSELHARASSSAITDDDDDDSDDDSDNDNCEVKYEPTRSTVDHDFNQGDYACSASLPSQGVKVETLQDAELDAVISSDDEEMAAYAASFDAQPAASTTKQSIGTNTVKNELSISAGHSMECAGDNDNEAESSLWPQLHGNQGTSDLKVEGIDDVTDFVSEIVHQPAALSSQTAGKLFVVINNGHYY